MVAQRCEGTEYHGTVYFKIVQMMNFMFICFYHNKKKTTTMALRSVSLYSSFSFRIFHLFEIPF